MTEELKQSGVVTTLSVIGFVFGIIGLFGSFIPFLGGIAFYVGLPASLISAVALIIAKSQKAKQTFAIVALTVSLIGVSISYFQYYQINKFVDKAKQELTGTASKRTITKPKKVEKPKIVEHKMDKITANLVKIHDYTCSPGEDISIIVPFDSEKYPLINKNPLLFYTFVNKWSEHKIENIKTEDLKRMLEKGWLGSSCYFNYISFNDISGFKITSQMRKLDKFELLEKRGEIIQNLKECYKKYKQEYKQIFQDTFILANSYPIKTKRQKAKGYRNFEDINITHQTGLSDSYKKFNLSDYNIDSQTFNIGVDIPIPLDVSKMLFSKKTGSKYLKRTAIQPKGWNSGHWDQGITFNTVREKIIFSKDKQPIYEVSYTPSETEKEFTTKLLSPSS